jgi:hypothetical protein
MSKTRPPLHQIELYIVELSALFNSMDPTPFHHRDLDADAREFLESWAMEFPQGSHFQINVHIENMPPENPEPLVTEAIHNYFEYRAMLTKRNLRLLLIEGRTSLLIGLSFLALCLLGAGMLSDFTNNTFLRVLKESLTISGWVAMWHPIQIFLYDWWPLVRRGRIYHQLHRANVHVIPGKRAARAMAT